MAHKDKTLEQLNITVVALVAVVAVVGITAIVLNGPAETAVEDNTIVEPVQNTAGAVYYYDNGEPKPTTAVRTSSRT